MRNRPEGYLLYIKVPDIYKSTFPRSILFWSQGLITENILTANLSMQTLPKAWLWMKIVTYKNYFLA